jgi:hypothetical protein
MLFKLITFLKKYWFRAIFFITGLGSLIWFLVRVIPKPSRAQYPCMKAAAPLASSFVCYLLGIGSLAVVYHHAKDRFKRSKYVAAFGFVLLGLIAGGVAIVGSTEKAKAYPLAEDQPVNQPVGDAKGIFPGRVVWVHDVNATNEKCTNGRSDFWSDDKNTNQEVVSTMLSASIRKLTGTDNDVAAWDSIFHYYNRTHGRGNVGYSPGEAIVIKINLNGLNGNAPKEKNVNTSPHLCYLVVEQLVDVAGVNESDIYIGDPGTAMTDLTYKRCHDDFPDVNYMGTGWGQYRVSSSGNKVFHYSDGISDAIELPAEFVDATYLINIPVFKKHHRAGISICAKNHVGTINQFSGQNYANGDWHESLPTPFGAGENINGDYGVYRCFVDIMGHQDLGGKTILYLVDGLWGSTNWGHPPVKFAMEPFNNDWPNSLFTSFDPVAIESVCYDFLYYEFDEYNEYEGGEITDDRGPFPHFNGVDDYLHQAADIASRPSDIVYDPEDDGSALGSLGTHEHWNNATDMKYSRNISSEGKGIELYKTTSVGKTEYKAPANSLVVNFPNPVKESTTLQFSLEMASDVDVQVFSLDGRNVSTLSLGKINSGNHNVLMNKQNGLPQTAGQYSYRLKVSNVKGYYFLSGKMSVVE